MKLVTKYQISAINSCWEKCDKKWAYMPKKPHIFNIDLYWKINRSLFIPRSPKGEWGILFYLCPSVHPRYFSSHFSQQLSMAEIWYLVHEFENTWGLDTLHLYFFNDTSCDWCINKHLTVIVRSTCKYTHK
jgi:hypothetical protein